LSEHVWTTATTDFGSIVQDCADLCRWLLAATMASRTTIRLAAPSGLLQLIAEATAPGVVSIRNGVQVDPTAFPTYRYLERTHALLIQSDTRSHPISPPPNLIDEFRVYAQMLAPVVSEGRLAGVISVHVQDLPRRFEREQIAALRDVQNRLTAKGIQQ
jgi:GAF domain-containing protein